MKPIFRMLGILIALQSLHSFAQETTEQTEPTESTEQSQQLSEQEAYWQWARETWESMNPITGEVELPGNVAVLTVPETFYYLSPKDAKTVLVDVWGNPPSQGEGILGMLFPAESTPFDGDSWGVTIEYSQDGYVSDEDAETIDYDELLTQMKKDTDADSENRVQQGYEAISLVGWAAQPYYDKESNKLHWAKELKFGDAEVNTLNYNIRVLGRKGVLVLNFIAGIDQLPVIDQNLDTVLDIAAFKPGSQYHDFDPDVDEVAAYGIGALVAGKVLTKTGFLAAAIMFLKKFGVFIAIGLFALVRKLFSRKKEQTTS